MVVANFFWHGPALRLYERACLSSFVRKGIKVHLHTFNASLSVPDGVRLVDARTRAQENEVLSLTQGGKVGSIAAFTDLFRYRLFRDEPGWWFDTDVYCLADASAFMELEARSKGLLIGEEAPGKLNGAVLFISRPDIAVELEKRADAQGKNFDWGAIGPKLITDYAAEFPDLCTVLSPEKFYPVHFDDVALLFRKEERDACEARTRNAICLHLWNEILSRSRIPPELMPCGGSYLHELFIATGQPVDPLASLDYGAFEQLTYAANISPAGRGAIRWVKRAGSAKRFLLRQH